VVAHDRFVVTASRQALVCDRFPLAGNRLGVVDIGFYSRSSVFRLNATAPRSCTTSICSRPTALWSRASSERSSMPSRAVGANAVS
jgi:hypothetical protein